MSNFRNSIWWDEDLLFKTEGMETWADSYRLSAYLFATDIEIGEMLRKGGIPNAWFSQSPGRSYYSVQSYMNLASFGETSIRSIPVKGSPRGVLIASVRPNQVTRVQLVIPKDYESRLAAALAREPLDVNELSLLMSPQPLEIKLIGTEPIESMP